MYKWEFVELSKVCNLEKGKTGLMKAKEGKYPLVTTGKTRKSCDNYQFDTKAVCIPLVSSTGHGHASLKYVHYQEGKFALGTILVAVIPKDENILNAKFLYLYLARLKDIILVPLMTGVVNVTLTVTKLKKVKIPLPPINEQLKIVSLFNRIDKEQNELKEEILYQQTLLKQLRQSILQEAIEGKLTISWREKNPNIESATHLLEKIKAEKERLIKEKKIKKQKALAPIDKNEVPFDIPNGWVWCRLGEIAYGFQYGTSSKSLKDGLIPVLRMGNIQNGLIVMNNFVYSNNKNDLEKYSLLYNDLLFNRTNSKELVGKTAIYNFKETAIYAGYLIRFRMLGKVSPNYINYLMNSQLHRNWCNKVKSDAIGQSNINATKLKSYLVPLPPFKEQKQIVQKIETLFSLCDKLEEQINTSKKSAEMLMQSVLKEAFGEDK